LVPPVRSVDTSWKLAALGWGSDHCCRGRHARTLNLFFITGKLCKSFEVSSFSASNSSIDLGTSALQTDVGFACEFGNCVI
jgi:hypothetical protein